MILKLSYVPSFVPSAAVTTARMMFSSFNVSDGTGGSSDAPPPLPDVNVPRLANHDSIFSDSDDGELSGREHPFRAEDHGNHDGGSAMLPIPQEQRQRLEMERVDEAFAINVSEQRFDLNQRIHHYMTGRNVTTRNRQAVEIVLLIQVSIIIRGREQMKTPQLNALVAFVSSVLGRSSAFF